MLQTVLGLQGLGEVLNYHPLFVHFPIALLLGSAFFYFLGVLLRKEDLLVAGKWTLYLGAVSAAAAVWQGLEAEKTAAHGAGSHEIMILHKTIAFAVLAMSAALGAWVFFSKRNLPAKGRPIFLCGLAVLAALLVQGGDLGGRMVFMYGTGVGRKSMLRQAPPQEHEHGGHEHGGHDHAGH